MKARTFSSLVVVPRIMVLEQGAFWSNGSEKVFFYGFTFNFNFEATYFADGENEAQTLYLGS